MKGSGIDRLPIRRPKRGKLKLYLGYCAGVGKTYQMLVEARRLRAGGSDVVVGLVETHGHEETEALLEGLEVLARHRVTYRGLVAEDLDLAAILKRRPAVVLVDDLAHTNLPGSRHAKRYQDVEEILAAGIHVLSAMNVQHLESLFETVARVTGVSVGERVPDRVLGNADQVVNVDISTQDLRQRLRDGKVRSRHSLHTDLEGYFHMANLERLRELTLRELAAHIDSRQHSPEKGNLSFPDPVLVCLNSCGPNREPLLRFGSRLARRLNRNWFAVHVQSLQESRVISGTEAQGALAESLALAQRLGATVFTFKGDDIVNTVLQFAREYRVGSIVVGRPRVRSCFLARQFGRLSIAERLMHESNAVTIVVFDAQTFPETAERKTAIPAAAHSGQHRIRNNRTHAATMAGTWWNMPIMLWSTAIEKPVAMQDLLAACLPLDSTRYRLAWQDLLERNRGGGTAVGEDLILLHTRVPRLDPFLAVGVAKLGIHDSERDRAARIMILLVLPQSPPDAHLGLVHEVDRMARNGLWRQRVLAATSIDEVRTAVESWARAGKVADQR